MPNPQGVRLPKLYLFVVPAGVMTRVVDSLVNVRERVHAQQVRLGGSTKDPGLKEIEEDLGVIAEFLQGLGLAGR